MEDEGAGWERERLGCRERAREWEKRRRRRGARARKQQGKPPCAFERGRRAHFAESTITRSSHESASMQPPAGAWLRATHDRHEEVGSSTCWLVHEWIGKPLFS
eukprot:5868405-Pleurochrysis_carterae.AAC.1